MTIDNKKIKIKGAKITKEGNKVIITRGNDKVILKKEEVKVEYGVDYWDGNNNEEEYKNHFVMESFKGIELLLEVEKEFNSNDVSINVTREYDKEEILEEDIVYLLDGDELFVVKVEGENPYIKINSQKWQQTNNVWDIDKIGDKYIFNN